MEGGWGLCLQLELGVIFLVARGGRRNLSSVECMLWRAGGREGGKEGGEQGF